jgi:hypothetical protein
MAMSDSQQPFLKLLLAAEGFQQAQDLGFLDFYHQQSGFGEVGAVRFYNREYRQDLIRQLTHS